MSPNEFVDGLAAGGSTNLVDDTERRFQVTRTEKVVYTRTFTEAQMIELGLNEDALDDYSLSDLAVDIEKDVDLLTAFTEATERHGDVTSNEFEIEEIP